MHATICDCLADAVQNAIEAGATRIEAVLEEDDEAVRITVRDDGKGMDGATLARVWDPFFTEPGKHARRRVGLGLPLLRQMAEATGGEVSIDTAKCLYAGLVTDTGRFQYEAVRPETLRLAANTLLWQRGDALLRLESALPLEESLRIARSAQPASR